MRRAGFLIVGLGAVAALLATPEPGNTRPRFGLRVLAVPLGIVGGLAHLRARHDYRHREPRRSFAHLRGRHGPAGAAGASLLASQPNWSGPVFWPSAYDDMFGYVADGSDARFWSGGFADVLAGILAPPGDERVSARRRARPITTASAEDNTTGAAPAVPETKSCGSLTARSADDIVARIEQAVRPRVSQQAALTDLRTAMVQAAGVLQRACPNTTPLTPIARLNAMQERLWAMQSAAQTVRTPLAALYAKLDDEQKARLNGSAPPQAGRAGRRADARAADPVQICSLQARDASARPIDEISARVRPTQDQQSGLKPLAETSGGMAKLLISSCPAHAPASAVDRLDAELGRLEAMLYAVSVVNSPLQGFYGTLNDEQKARFNSLGNPTGS